MSRSTRSHAELRRDGMRAALRAALPGISSTELTTLAQRPVVATTVNSAIQGLESATKSILASAPISSTLNTARPQAITRSTNLLQRSREAFETGAVTEALQLAVEGDRVLRSGIAAAAVAVARQERIVTGTLVSD